MKHIILWFEFFINLLGTMFICLINFDTKNLIDTYYWLRVHLNYSGSCVSFGKHSLKRYFIDLIGLIILGFPFILLIILL